MGRKEVAMRFFNAVLFITAITLTVPGCALISQGMGLSLFITLMGMLGMSLNYTSGKKVTSQGEALVEEGALEELLSQEGMVIHDAGSLHAEHLAAQMWESVEDAAWVADLEVEIMRMEMSALCVAFDGVLARNDAEIDAMQADAYVVAEEAMFQQEMRNMGFPGPFTGALPLSVVWGQ
jgi:hypothetical protein